MKDNEMKKNPSCVYLGEKVDKDKETYDCRFYGQCILGRGDQKIVGCRKCKKKLHLDHPEFPSKWQDPLIILDRNRDRTESLRGLLAGASVFLIAGGPSANEVPLELLSRRGIWSMAVNNMAAHHRFRPQAFVCSDPPKKFSHDIWLDPGIMKFTPTAKMSGMRSRLRRKLPSGEFERLDRKVPQCPNVWGFRRNSWLTPDNDFFLSDGACWGNQNAGVERTGQNKTVCTPLCGIRLLKHLGASIIYLVGFDFRMSPTYGYAFDQGRTLEASLSNNEHFENVNRWLCEMQEGGVFKQFGLQIFNTNQTSNLRAFPHVPFDRAIEEAQGIVSDKPDTLQWYEK